MSVTGLRDVAASQLRRIGRCETATTRLEAAWDITLISIVVVLSVLPYVGSMGFYSDDWDFLSLFTFSPDQSIPGLAARSWEAQSHVHVRPVQIVYYAALYKLFGLDPLGYHLVTALVHLVIAVGFYLVLRELGLPRRLAVGVPIVFITLPHYATTRWWFSSLIYPTGLALYFLSSFADLRAVRRIGHVAWGWKSVSMITLLLATLSVELVIPLFVMNIGVLILHMWWRRVQVPPTRPLLRREVGFVAINVVVLGVIMAYKIALSERTGVQAAYVDHVLYLAKGIVRIHAIEYGIGFPLAAAWSTAHLSLQTVGLAVVTGVIVYAYLVFVTHRTSDVLPSRTELALAAIIGGGILALGYAVFLTTDQILFTSTGVSNRVALVSSIGVALIVTSLVGWLVTWFPSEWLRRHSYGALIGLIVTSGILIVTVVASYWVEAAEQQQRVLRQIDQDVALSSATTLILDGVCPYDGPGIVFEAPWDVAGALRIRRDNGLIAADILRQNADRLPEGLRLSVYGYRTLYPYGDHLLLYNVADAMTYRLVDDQAAAVALSRSTSNTRNGCSGREGYGQTVLPISSYYERLRNWLR